MYRHPQKCATVTGNDNKIYFIGCIDCMRCSLLLPMIAVSVCLSVSLSRGYTGLYCAKTAERIKTLFVVNSLGAHGTLCLTGVLIHHSEGKGLKNPHYWLHIYNRVMSMIGENSLIVLQETLQCTKFMIYIDDLANVMKEEFSGLSEVYTLQMLCAFIWKGLGVTDATDLMFFKLADSGFGFRGQGVTKTVK